MRKIKNWTKFNEKPFKVVDDEIKRGDNFISNNDGEIRTCRSIQKSPKGSEHDSINNYAFERGFCKKIVFDDSAQMEFEEEKFPTVKTTPPNLKKGDLIYLLDGYDLMRGEVISIGPKNVKIEAQCIGPGTYTTSKPFDRVAEPDESICVVWQRWKGIEGSYRIERELYPQYRRPAKNWPWQQHVWEDFYGELSGYQILD